MAPKSGSIMEVYIIYYCTDPISGKNLVPELWAEMLTANQISGFSNL